MAAAVSDESLVLQLHYEELRRQQQLEDDAALALALHLSAGVGTGDTVDNDNDAEGANTSDVFLDSSAPGGSGGGDGGPGGGAGAYLDIAKALLTDGDHAAALSEALQIAQAADTRDRDAAYTGLLGRHEAALQFVTRLDARQGLPPGAYIRPLFSST